MRQTSVLDMILIAADTTKGDFRSRLFNTHRRGYYSLFYGLRLLRQSQFDRLLIGLNCTEAQLWGYLAIVCAQLATKANQGSIDVVCGVCPSVVVVPDKQSY